MIADHDTCKIPIEVIIGIQAHVAIRIKWPANGLGPKDERGEQ